MPRKAAHNLTPQLIDELRIKGFTQAEIAEMHGVSKGTVTYVKQQGKTFHKTPREEAQEHFPIKNVPRALQRNTTYQRVTDHIENSLIGDKGMSERQVKLLKAWHKKLRDLKLIVVYDPEIPPNIHAKSGGWSYETREQRDGDLIIRINDYVSLTDKARELLRIPGED
ncbi:hypothetical protein [Amycolatopsis minnesotensis]|uniref:Uncharacterized protein n=1 Tax=Amycolatopsis minnesotensis TaxID=337894 RepID=A0ABN2Q166_9PSEU